MIGIIGTVLGIIGPLLIRGVLWILDYMQAKDQTKKDFFRFVASWEGDVGSPVKLQDSVRAQVEELKKLREQEQKNAVQG